MVLGAKFGVSATFNLAYVASAYLFPSIYSATAFGICNIFARITTILAPEVAEVKAPVPMILFTILAGIAAVLSFFIRTKQPKIK